MQQTEAWTCATELFEVRAVGRRSQSQELEHPGDDDKHQDFLLGVEQDHLLLELLDLTLHIRGATGFAARQSYEGLWADNQGARHAVG